MEPTVTYNNNTNDLKLPPNNGTYPPQHYDYYYPWYEREIHYWYPDYPTIEESKVDKAFRVLRRLFKKGLLKKVQVKKFIELVHEISEEL